MRRKWAHRAIFGVQVWRECCSAKRARPLFSDKKNCSFPARAFRGFARFLGQTHHFLRWNACTITPPPCTHPALHAICHAVESRCEPTPFPRVQTDDMTSPVPAMDGIHLDGEVKTLIADCVEGLRDDHRCALQGALTSFAKIMELTLSELDLTLTTDLTRVFTTSVDRIEEHYAVKLNATLRELNAVLRKYSCYDIDGNPFLDSAIECDTRREASSLSCQLFSK